MSQEQAIKHNDTVTGYPKQLHVCTYDQDAPFPFSPLPLVRNTLSELHNCILYTYIVIEAICSQAKVCWVTA